MTSDLNDLGYVQGEIHAAEQRIQAELLRISSLAQFRDLWVDIRIQTERRLNAAETVSDIVVKIRAVL